MTPNDENHGAADGGNALRLIGYWRNDQHPEFPDPSDFVDEDWDRNQRFRVWSYLVAGTMLRAFMGYSTCRICGELNGTSEFTDGTYLWPEGLAHYVIDHGVRLPDEVVEHAERRWDALEARPIDQAWWLSATT